MADSAGFLVERLRKEGDKTIAFFSELSPEQWQSTVYTEGETWTIRNVLSHFVTAEKGFLEIFSDIRNGGQGVSEDFNIDRYNSSQQKKTKELNEKQLLEQFQNIRAQMINLIDSFSDEDLAKQGRHPFLGITSLAEMIKMVYRHNQIHYRDLRKILGE